MIFAQPIAFAEPISNQQSAISNLLLCSISFSDLSAAADSATLRELRQILGSQLETLAPDILNRADFLSRTAAAEFLQEFADVLDQYSTGEIDLGSARIALGDKLTELNYSPTSPEDAGTLPDLSSDIRLNLMLDTNAEMAAGYVDWSQGQDEAVLDQWPAQELYRAYPRKVPRDLGPLPWAERWAESGGQLFDGRMIALKNTELWDNLGSFPDGLGNPYPPFAFNSGMDVRDIDRDTAVSLGLIDETTQIAPQSREFNQDFSVTPDVQDPELRAQLEEEGYSFDGDSLSL